MSMCQPNSMLHVRVNVLYLIWSSYVIFIQFIFIFLKMEKFCPSPNWDQI